MLPTFVQLEVIVQKTSSSFQHVLVRKSNGKTLFFKHVQSSVHSLQVYHIFLAQSQN
jgi:hypothetical protein